MPTTIRPQLLCSCSMPCAVSLSVVCCRPTYATNRARIVINEGYIFSPSDVYTHRLCNATIRDNCFTQKEVSTLCLIGQCLQHSVSEQLKQMLHKISTGPCHCLTNTFHSNRRLKSCFGLHRVWLLDRYFMLRLEALSCCVAKRSF
jgi:hypothetical protein